MTEASIQKKVIDYLTAKGCFVVKVINANKDGVPDLLVCVPSGLFCAIEMKKPGKTPDELQEFQIEQIRKAGGIAFFARSVEEVRKGLTNYLPP